MSERGTVGRSVHRTLRCVKEARVGGIVRTLETRTPSEHDRDTRTTTKKKEFSFPLVRVRVGVGAGRVLVVRDFGEWTSQGTTRPSGSTKEKPTESGGPGSPTTSKEGVPEPEHESSEEKSEGLKENTKEGKEKTPGTSKTRNSKRSTLRFILSQFRVRVPGKLSVLSEWFRN